MNAAKKVMIMLAVLGLLLPDLAAGPGSEELITPGTIYFNGVLVPQALLIYKELTGATLYVDSQAKQSAAQIVCKNEKPVSKAQAIKMIETALLEQAAVVITKLDSNRVSVTFNDALPVKPVEKNKGS